MAIAIAIASVAPGGGVVKHWRWDDRIEANAPQLIDEGGGGGSGGAVEERIHLHQRSDLPYLQTPAANWLGRRGPQTPGSVNDREFAVHSSP